MAARRWRSSPSTSRLSIISPRACRPSSDCRDAKNLSWSGQASTASPGPIATGRSVAHAGATSDAIADIGGYGCLLSEGRPRPNPGSAARPDVEHVAIFGAEILDPAQTRIGIGALAFAIDRNQCRLDVGLHLSAVAADVNDRAAFDQAPNAFPLRRDKVLHIGLRSFCARESGVQLGDAVGVEGFQFIRVEKILIGMAAAEEQHRRPKLCALGLERGTLLQEAAERRQTRSGPDHDDRHGRIVGQPEPGLGLANRRLDRLARAAAREIVRADAFIDAAARTRGPLDHADGDAATRGVARWR